MFDEWAVISLAENKARVLQYTGPRNDDFLKNFVRDLGALRAGLLGGQYGPGDFEFSRHGTGTGFESFLVLGPGILSHLQPHAREHGNHRQKSALAGRAGAVRGTGRPRARQSGGGFVGHEAVYQGAIENHPHP